MMYSIKTSSLCFLYCSVDYCTVDILNWSAQIIDEIGKNIMISFFLAGFKWRLDVKKDDQHKSGEI